MKNRYPKDKENRAKLNGSRSINRNNDSMKKKKKKNMRRMGGQGLSLEAFANAKSNSSYFNPALIKKQKEFYKNSKYVNKYKKSLKQQLSNPLAIRPLEEEIETDARGKERNETKDRSEEKDANGDHSKKENETRDGSKTSKNDKKRKRYGARNLVDVYEKKHEEEEKARMEREAIIQAKKEEREKAEARRKSLRDKMLKKTHKGQPRMKYRIEHLLETLQGSVNKT